MDKESEGGMSDGLLMGVFILAGCVGLAWVIAPPPPPLEFVIAQTLLLCRNAPPSASEMQASADYLKQRAEVPSNG